MHFKLPLRFRKKSDPLVNLVTPPNTPNPSRSVLTKKATTIILGVLGLFFVLGLLFTILILLPAKSFTRELQSSYAIRKPALQAAISSKNLNKLKAEIEYARQDLQTITERFGKLRILRLFPVSKAYYQDGQVLLDTAVLAIDSADIAIKAIEPYQDFLGLAGTSTDSGKTTEDRITFLTQSVESLLPHLNSLEEKTKQIEKNILSLDPNRYPEEYKGTPIRSRLLSTQTTIKSINKLITDGRPLLENTAWLLGKDKPRSYLMIFQNDAELRPTGGFWTAYGLLTITNGKITPALSEDIYTLDARFDSTIPAPRPIKDYQIKVPYWHLRDMNISPDFPTSIETFLSHYATLPSSQPIDAVFALDTQVLVDLVQIMGRIGVPGWGNFSPEPDDRCYGCPQIIYQLEYLADKPLNKVIADRKGFMAPLMHSLLSNAMGSPKEKIAELAGAAWTNLQERHILIYFPDEKLQKSINALGFAGSVVPVDTDYVMLVDANMGGAKTNMFINQSINHQITNSAGKIAHTLTIVYENPHPASNCNLEKGDLCLNAPKYRNWFRLYVPKGSKLTKLTGSELEPLVYDELDKTVIEGFYGNKYPLFAESSNRITIAYESPVSPDNYQLYIQKQAGSKPIHYTLNFADKKEEVFDLRQDKKLSFNW